jgi:FkbM family methyltransferase
MRPIRRLLRRVLNRFGYDVHRIGFGRDLMDFIRSREIDVVLDVGANVGQFGESLRAGGFLGKIISFEPLSAAYEALAVKAEADGNWDSHHFALGAKTERRSINVAAMSVFSSLLPFTAAAGRHHSGATLARCEEIDIRTLDEVCPRLSGKTLLKIDTQGYEQPVLEGGRCTLPMMRGVLMELPIVSLYQQTWQLHEAIVFMADAGFVPAQFHPVSYHTRDSVSLIEVDCLFRRHDSRIDWDKSRAEDA